MNHLVLLTDEQLDLITGWYSWVLHDWDSTPEQDALCDKLRKIRDGK